MPRVSVIVPNYNHGRFLERRLASIYEQTYQDFELILLDDASIDGSAAIFEAYRTDPRVRIIVNDVNSGSPFSQWNRGVEVARGEYIWIAEADDDAEPQLLQTLVQQLDSTPAAVLAYCQSWVIDEEGRRLGTGLTWTEDLDKTRWTARFCSPGVDEARHYLAFKNTIPNASAVVFRRGVFLEVGGAPSSMHLSGDRLTWVLMALKGDIVFVPVPLNSFRDHSYTVRSRTSPLRRLQEGFEVVELIQRQAGIPQEVARTLASRLRSDWEREYATCHDPIASSLLCRVGLFLWRMSSWEGFRFFAFFLLRLAPESVALGPARKLWRLYKRLANEGRALNL